MRDISSILLKYRECARTIWNSYLLKEEGGSFDDVDEFQQVSQKLFDVLVLRKLQLTLPIEEIGRNPIQAIKLVVTASAGIPVMINRDIGKRGGYWDAPINRLEPSKAEVVFVDFFDWDVLTYRDLQYYLVFIQSFEEQSELVGRYALIEVHHATPMVAEN